MKNTFGVINNIKIMKQYFKAKIINSNDNDSIRLKSSRFVEDWFVFAFLSLCAIFFLVLPVVLNLDIQNNPVYIKIPIYASCLIVFIFFIFAGINVLIDRKILISRDSLQIVKSFLFIRSNRIFSGKQIKNILFYERSIKKNDEDEIILRAVIQFSAKCRCRDIWIVNENNKEFGKHIDEIASLLNVNKVVKK